MASRKKNLAIVDALGSAEALDKAIDESDKYLAGWCRHREGRSGQAPQEGRRWHGFSRVTTPLNTSFFLVSLLLHPLLAQSSTCTRAGAARAA